MNSGEVSSRSISQNGLAIPSLRYTTPNLCRVTFYSSGRERERERSEWDLRALN